MAIPFIHLLTHTEYSLVDGLCRIKPLVNQVLSLGLPAQAITDRCNLFGMVKFYKAAMQQGIKPIMGADLWWTADTAESAYRMVFLCQNNTGYANLIRLISKAYLEGPRTKSPLVKWEWLDKSSTEGLIALSGAQHGDIGRALLADNQGQASDSLKHWLALFDDRFYLELQRVGKPNETAYIDTVAAMAAREGVPLVATNDVCFLTADDFDAHEARVCIHEGYQVDDPARPRVYTRQQYLRSPAEMQRLFADYPESLANTVEIAKRCNASLTLGKNFLPRFPTPDALSVDDYLATLSRKGLEERLQILFENSPEALESQRKTYEERLEIELSVIIQMGFAGYFLIVQDFIAWAKSQRIPVGPGRGSGAGSLVAYALQITDLDPLAYDLLFERFLNPERVSMPDFDIDFCMDKRDLVIEYVAERYGKASVSQIITFGTMAAKAVVRDVGRVLGHPYGFVDKIAKLIPFELGITLDKALEQEETLRKRYHAEEEVRELINLARKLEGITRNAGKHAGGVVISPSLLTDFTPLFCEEGGGNVVSQFDKDDVEAVGLVKFDFLGLRTLTIIDWACQTIKKTQGVEVKIDRIPLDDPKTFELLKACQTTAVFQLESRGMKDLIKRLQPDCFEDIVALVALFRPGPLQSGMVDDFINRKHGRQRVEYPHPDLEPILKPTYGVILYQEQVMQIAQVLAGYTLGGADLLRRAMGKKKPEEMAKQRAIFVEGSTARGVEGSTATLIFDLMEKFAGYGFNKSHSAAYALVSYQTAWLKTHHPAAFMSAVLSSDMDNTDKVVTLIEETRAMQIPVEPPHINHSYYQFTVGNAGQIIYGLGAIKGAGSAAIDVILACRKASGEFSDLVTLCCNVDLRKVNKRVLEALIRAGALDFFGVHRAALMTQLESAMQCALQTAEDRVRGQGDLFGAISYDHVVTQQEEEVAPWPDAIRLRGELETLGLYLTGHPLDAYVKELKCFVETSLSMVRPQKDRIRLMAGLVVAVRAVKTKTGRRMAILSLDDRTAKLDVTLFSDLYDEMRDKCQANQLLVIAGEASLDEYSGRTRVTAKDIMTMDEARERYAKCLTISLSDTIAPELIERLAHLLRPYQGGMCPVKISYSTNNWSVNLRTGVDWKIRFDSALWEMLEAILPPSSFKLEY